MSRLFDPDSPLMTALSTLMDFFVFSALTVVCSIPVVTAGAAWCALYASMADLTAGSSLHIRSYFDHFRRLFKPATKCWITVLALAYLFFLDFQAIGSLPSSMRVFFWGGVLFLVFCLLMAAAFLPPVIDAHPSLPFLRLWKMALVQGIGRLPRSLAILAALAIPLAVLSFSAKWFALLILVWSFLWPAASCYLWARLTVRLLQPHRFPE